MTVFFKNLGLSILLCSIFGNSTFAEVTNNISNETQISRRVASEPSKSIMKFQTTPVCDDGLWSEDLLANAQIVGEGFQSKIFENCMLKSRDKNVEDIFGSNGDSIDLVLNKLKNDNTLKTLNCFSPNAPRWNVLFLHKNYQSPGINGVVFDDSPLTIHINIQSTENFRWFPYSEDRQDDHKYIRQHNPLFVNTLAHEIAHTFPLRYDHVSFSLRPVYENAVPNIVGRCMHEYVMKKYPLVGEITISETPILGKGRQGIE